MRRQPPVNILIVVVLSNERDMLCPVESSLFAVTVDSGLAPCRKQVKLGRRHIELASVVEVILNAKCATIQLRDANLEEFEQFGLDPGLTQSMAYRGHSGAHLRNDALE